VKKSMRETVSKEALASAPAANDDETSELMAQAFQHSFEKLCLSAGLRAFQDMMAQEVAALCGARHQRQDVSDQKLVASSGRCGRGPGPDHVGQAGDGVGGDAEAVAEIGPERDGVLLAGLLQRQECVATSSAVVASGASADLA